MKMYVSVLFLVTLLCLVTPATAGPIPIGSPSDTTSSDNGFPGPDFFASLHSSAPGNSGSLGDPLVAMGSAGSDRLIGGGQSGPPIPAPVPEPSGLMVMFGAGLFGVVPVVHRKLKA